MSNYAHGCKEQNHEVFLCILHAKSWTSPGHVSVGLGSYPAYIHAPEVQYVIVMDAFA
jgi:hypothetical protein